MNHLTVRSRRHFLRHGFCAFLAAGFFRSHPLHAAGCCGAATPQNVDPSQLFFESLTYPYELAPLPYGTEAFVPDIDALTMEIHHGRHHAAYVRNLNRALEDYPQFQARSLEDLLANVDTLPQAIRQTVRDNGGGHANHALYWATMKPSGSRPAEALQAAIEKHFGSMDALENALVDAGLRRFGSGWAWLNINAEGELIVSSTANQDNPHMFGEVPLLGIDVWEHAYYLNFKNRRGDYLKAFLKHVDWQAVSSRYDVNYDF
jgi:Fe-Mn family superoxide dismutase